MTTTDPRTTTQARRFVKSSWSGGNGGDCVEWAYTPTGVHVRDSKDRVGPELLLTYAEWDDLTTAAATGTAHESISPAGDGIRLTARGGELFFTHSEWNAFVAGAKAGECRPALGVAS
jgi:hypothetical protein